MEIVAAADLARHSRVILNLDDIPHLVDSVQVRPSGTVAVTFSSGEFRVWDADSPVVVAA